MVDFHRELYRLAADLAVLDVARGAGAKIEQRVEGFAAVRTLHDVKLTAPRRAGRVADPWLEDGLQAKLGINAARFICGRIATASRP
jgi:hypothetical protein